MDAGKPFAITHTDSTYGSMLFNSFVSAIGGIFSTTVFQLSGVTYCAQLIADLTENQWIFSAFTLATTADIPESLRNPYALTINGTSYDGSKAVNIESIKGDTGQRGTGLLAVTTAPSSYTTAVGGITPKYRMSLSTIKSQSGVTEVLLGDTVRSSYYHYPIAYLDDSYAYFTTRISIRGTTGSAGEAGADGKSAYVYAQEAGYTGTEEEFAQKLAQEPLIGSTADITPSQVAEAIETGRDVAVTYNDATYGAVVFSSFIRAYSFNAVASSEILHYDGAYLLVELCGSTADNKWALLTTQLAQYSDIPSVPNSLKNPYGLTINGTSYDGSQAVDLTEAVNNMIVAKLNALTHAEEVAF